MEIKDIGFVLSLQRFQEANALVKVFSRYHGICTGFVKNFNSKSNKSCFFPSNLVDFIWNARLNEHVGLMRAELNTAFSSIIMQNYLVLQSINSLFALLEINFKEREEVKGMFDYIQAHLNKLINNGFSPKEYIDFELYILAQAGYRLDFSKCVVTGDENDLIYLSPKSGKAVSARAGQPYSERLLKLPSFLTSRGSFEPKLPELLEALNITSYFFERYIFNHINNKSLISPRENLIKTLIK